MGDYCGKEHSPSNDFLTEIFCSEGILNILNVGKDSTAGKVQLHY